MPNQRVVVLTDEEVRSLLALLGEDYWSALISAKAKLVNAPKGITDEMMGNLLNNLRGFDAGDEQDWIDARRALEAALFPGDEQ